MGMILVKKQSIVKKKSINKIINIQTDNIFVKNILKNNLKLFDSIYICQQIFKKK